MDVDAEYDHDASLAMYEARGARGNVEQRARRDKAAQVCLGSRFACLSTCLAACMQQGTAWRHSAPSHLSGHSPSAVPTLPLWS